MYLRSIKVFNINQIFYDIKKALNEREKKLNWMKLEFDCVIVLGGRNFKSNLNFNIFIFGIWTFYFDLKSEAV